MYEPKLGVSFHKISDRISSSLVEQLANRNVETIEVLSNLFMNDGVLKESHRILKDYRLEVATIHLPYDSGIDISSLDSSMKARYIDTMMKGIETAAFLEAKRVVVHASSEPIEPSVRSQRILAAQDSVEDIVEKCRACGIRLAVEILPRSCLGNTYEEVESFIAPYPEDLVGFCIDTNHLMDLPDILPSLVSRAGERLFNLHVSDYDGVDEKHWLPGQGVIDWMKLLSALESTGYDGPFNYECNFDPAISPEERITAIGKAHSRLVAKWDEFNGV